MGTPRQGFNPELQKWHFRQNLSRRFIMEQATTAVQTPATDVAAANQIKMEVSKTVPGVNGAAAKREPVGSVSFYAPSLAELGLPVEPVAVAEDGSLKYADLTHTFIYDAVIAAVKAKVRNSLKSGTTELKPGQSFATNLLELVTPSENTNTVLADRRALISMFADWLTNSDIMKNKAPGLKLLLKTFLEKPDTLVVQPADKRVQIGKFFEAFGGAVEEKLNEYQGNYLVDLIEKCNAADEDFTFDL